MRRRLGALLALVISAVGCALLLSAMARNPRDDAKLAAAANAGNLLMVRALLAQGADPNALCVPAPGTPMWRQAIDPMYGRIPALTLAANRDSDEIMEELLHRGAKPDITDNIGSTPLMWVASHRSNTPGTINSINLLLQHGANVNAANERGMTALMYAASSATPEIIKMLIAHGADPKATDGSGHNSLSWARTFGNKAAMEMLQNAAN